MAVLYASDGRSVRAEEQFRDVAVRRVSAEVDVQGDPRLLHQ